MTVCIKSPLHSILIDVIGTEGKKSSEPSLWNYVKNTYFRNIHCNMQRLSKVGNKSCKIIIAEIQS